MTRQRLERELATCQKKLKDYSVVGLDDVVELRAKVLEYEKRMGPLDPIAPHIAKNYIYPEKTAKQEDGITVPFKVVIVILLVLGIGATWSTFDYAKSTYDMLKSFTSKIVFQPR